MKNHEHLRDEELLLLIRVGDQIAENTLALRYFSARYLHASNAAKNAIPLLKPYDFNALFFKTYLASVNSFRFGRGLFRYYFTSSLEHDIYREIQMNAQDRYLQSFEEAFEEENQMCLHDVLPSESNNDDPKAFIDYAETLSKINKLPRGINKKVLKLVEMKYLGYSEKETLRRLRITKGEARQMLLRFRKFAEKVLDHPLKKIEDDF